ncbi:MAG: CoA-transferase [Thermodesulfobacteriota bacterium]|nr:CoA-transferase [Thermodesulfobacteriota bacterium]
MTGKRKKKKLMSPADLAGLINPGIKLAIGGMLFHNRPVAMIRHIVKHKINGLTLYSSPLSSYDVDLLVGAGLVSETYLPHVSFGHLGFAPNYINAIRAKQILAHLCDEAAVCGGFLASSEGLPYHPVVSLKETDILKHESGVKVKRFRSEDGEDILCVPAICPDLAIIHAQEGDEFGNIRHKLAVYADRLMAEASKTVIVSVEKLISNEEIRREPFLTTIPSHLVDAVVEIPYGAHPCSSMGLFLQDEGHIKEYIEASKAQETFDEYLDKYVYGPKTMKEYVEAIGGKEKLKELEVRWP